MTSFGLGSDHIREKDGIFAILCWLSIVAGNVDSANHYWKTYGRNYYTRYDYEGITTEKADDLMKHLYQQIEEFKQPSK